MLGSCPAEVAAGALAFRAPEHVRAVLETCPPALTHRQVSEHYLTRITAWGEDTIGVFDM